MSSSRPSASAAKAQGAAAASSSVSASASASASGPASQGTPQNVSQGHFSVRAQHVSIADEKKYRKKYAELASKLRALEKDNDELVTKYETVKHLLLRLKAEKKILIDVLDKIYEQEEQDNNPIPPQSKDGFTVHALPITTDRHLIDKALIVPPHKHQALGITSPPPADPTTSSIYALQVSTPSANAAAAAATATSAATIKRAPSSSAVTAPTATTNKQTTAAATTSARKSDSMDVDQKPSPTTPVSADAATAVATGNLPEDNNMDLDASSVLSDPGQHPPPAKRPRLAGPPPASSDKPQVAQPQHSAQPARKIGSVASLLDDSAAPAPTHAQPPAPSSTGRPSQSPLMRPSAATASSHHGYPHPTSGHVSTYPPSSYSSGGPPPPPPGLPHHHLQHHHGAYPDYPPLHSPTASTNSASAAPGGGPGPAAYSSRASSVSQLSSSGPSAASSAYPPPAPPGAYTPATSIPPPPPTSRPGPEYFEPAPYRSSAGAPTSPGAYEYHHHAAVAAAAHYHHHHHHHPPPPPHRPPPPPGPMRIMHRRRPCRLQVHTMTIRLRNSKAKARVSSMVGRGKVPFERAPTMLLSTHVGFLIMVIPLS
ncbi:hypothetical protein BCR44DRAFT_1459893 [Catenaria anguillulae PL171]|uniref:INO80 complex subunit F domain-containing protein n=1 Tax=Catenaria anguillulae PL171 TaxID=765915 RepID=A0A1Y2HW40_9FUNG|nr:hypothetical protein BCR44DRAFT_1459893 [Catenaria anguillulae PL171]